MRQVIRAQYRAVIREQTEEDALLPAFEQCEKRVKKELESGNILTGTLCRYQNMLFFYVEYIGEKFPELSEHLWEKNMEQIAEGWFLDLQEFLEVWPSVKGGGNTKRRWLYM